MSRRRNWCFTLHLPDDTEYERTSANRYLEIDKPTVRYAVWQLETCPSTGRLHLQGYIEFTDSKRKRAVKLILGSNRVHLEPRFASREQAREYCRKDDSRTEGPWEHGTFDVDLGGRPKLLTRCTTDISNGASLDDIVENYPCLYVRYRRGLGDIIQHYARRAIPVWRDVSVLVYYGDTGLGKTRKAIADNVDDFYMLDHRERTWFDGYHGQSTLIIDDYYGWLKYHTLLRILDGHPYECEIKGGFVAAAWTQVIITSNKHPELWYTFGLTPALERRFHEIIHFPIEVVVEAQPE